MKHAGVAIWNYKLWWGADVFEKLRLNNCIASSLSVLYSVVGYIRCTLVRADTKGIRSFIGDITQGIGFAKKTVEYLDGVAARYRLARAQIADWHWKPLKAACLDEYRDFAACTAASLQQARLEFVRRRLPFC